MPCGESTLLKEQTVRIESDVVCVAANIDLPSMDVGYSAPVPRKSSSAVPTWPEIYQDWRRAWPRLEDAAPYVTKVVVPRPNEDRFFAPRVLDWWPWSEVEQRRTWLTEFGIGGIRWETRAGDLHTAKLLDALAADPEAVAAIWIIGLLRPIDNKLARPVWEHARHLLAAVHDLAVEELRRRNCDLWHHASRDVVPDALMSSRFERMLRPTQIRDVVELARLQSLVVRGQYALVEVTRVAA
jgi:hypothetical protein